MAERRLGEVPNLPRDQLRGRGVTVPYAGCRAFTRLPSAPHSGGVRGPPLFRSLSFPICEMKGVDSMT